MIIPDVRQGAEYRLRYVHPMGDVRHVITVALDEATKIDEEVHTIDEMTMHGYWRAFTLLFFALFKLNRFISQCSFA